MSSGQVVFSISCMKETPSGVERNVDPYTFPNGIERIEEEILQTFQDETPIIDFHIVKFGVRKIVVSIEIDGDTSDFESSIVLPETFSIADGDDECHVTIEDVSCIWY